ncbi:hypothetical protein [Halococcus sp. AFM35]|uniref:hypothetical protein n=1 Tax=Halococcus sp. AFM35 TaxID=3421653 RepID=UPI003EB79B3E
MDAHYPVDGERSEWEADELVEQTDYEQKHHEVEEDNECVSTGCVGGQAGNAVDQEKSPSLSVPVWKVMLLSLEG